MNSVSAISVNPSPSSARPHRVRAVETPKPPEPTDVEAMSLESKLDLSQKAQVQPPTPPAQSSKKKKTEERPVVKSDHVEGQDFAGRTCTGTLSGPLLMEDPGAPEMSFDNPADYGAMRSASAALGKLSPEQLRQPAGEAPVMTDGDIRYMGVQDEHGHLIQHLENGEGEAVEESQVTLKDGQVVHITRSENQLSIRIPAACLDDLASWGRTLLAVA